MIKLILKPGKSIAPDPSSFRPIALTSVIGKNFTSILKDQLFDHLITNKYLSTDVQKGFINHVNGCQEHQFKPVEAVRNAMIMKLYSDAVTSLKPLCAYQLSSVDHDMFLSIFEMVLQSLHEAQRKLSWSAREQTSFSSGLVYRLTPVNVPRLVEGNSLLQQSSTQNYISMVKGFHF